MAIEFTKEDMDAIEEIIEHLQYSQTYDCFTGERINSLYLILSKMKELQGVNNG